MTTEAEERFCEDFEFVDEILERVDDVRCGGRDGDEADSSSIESNDRGEEARKRDEVMRLKDLFPRTSGEIRVLLS